MSGPEKSWHVLEGKITLNETSEVKAFEVNKNNLGNQNYFAISSS